MSRLEEPAGGPALRSGKRKAMDLDDGASTASGSGPAKRTRSASGPSSPSTRCTASSPSTRAADAHAVRVLAADVVGKVLWCARVMEADVQTIRELCDGLITESAGESTVKVAAVPERE